MQIIVNSGPIFFISLLQIPLTIERKSLDSCTSDSMNSNYIGTLKEKLDKFHGIVTPPRYATSNSGAGFECELSLSLTRLDLSPRAFTVRSTGVTSSKKAAEQSAAYVMLSTPSFVNFYNGNFAALAEEHARVPQAAPQVTQAPQAPNNSTHSLVSVPEPPSTATTLLASVSASQIAAVVNTNENFKGQLLEQIAKHAPHYEANFESSQPAPFLSTVTVQVLGGGGGERLVAAGMAATTKKQAEQSAAAAMLSSAAFQSLCSTSRVSTRQLVAALFQTTTEHMMELSSPGNCFMNIVAHTITISFLSFPNLCVLPVSLGRPSCYHTTHRPFSFDS